MIDGLVGDSTQCLAVAELLLNRYRGRKAAPVLQQARVTLDQAWTAVERRTEADISLVTQADALEAAILERGRDDYVADTAGVVVFAVRSLTSRDEQWPRGVWNVTWELLENINERAPSVVSLNAVRRAIPQFEPAELHRWAQAQDIVALVRALRPTIPASVRRIARAASKLSPDVQAPAAAVALADARRRALEVIGVAAFAKALEPLAAALPLGEVDARWQPAADRILADVAGARISGSDQRFLNAGFEAISPGGQA